jgi:hypothetical protein
MPKLIGMAALPFARVRKGQDGAVEYIDRVGFDVDGQAWGLVVRSTPAPPVSGSLNRIRARRINYVRWVRFDAIAFAPDEVVTETSWETAETEPPI